jgi:DNA-binding transcriptional regulator YiaG
MSTAIEATVLKRSQALCRLIEVPEQFGDIIRSLINEASLPVPVIAKALGCSEMMIRFWEQGKKLPGPDMWPDLTDSVIELIDRELKE